jgi:beta-lactamase regulating signal transducer with metallopeptidase domain
MAWLLTWLVHGLTIALVTRFALRALPGLSAATRYAMWWAALVLVLILPIVRGLSLTAGAGLTGDAGAQPQASAVSGASTSPSASSSPSSSSSPQTFSSSSSSSVSSFSLPPVSLPRVPDWFVSIVIGLWLGCAMLGLAQLAYSVQTVRRLKASCRRMLAPREADLPMWSAMRARGRAVRVRASDRVQTAAVLGLTRPVIAVPRDAAAALTPHEIDQVVLHEYAHVQRYDDWTKLLQVLIGAFAGWHPAVRMMMREIDFEREAACDDYVVDVTGAPRAYARCLTKVIEMMPGSSFELAALPHAFSSASHATTRIERLLDRKRPSGRLAVMPAMAGSATLAVLAFCTVHALPIATDHPRAGDPRAERLAAAAGDANAASPTAQAAPVAPRGYDLRIASASMLPIDASFPSFSPLSRLTDARRAASAASGAMPTATATPPAVSAPSASPAPSSAVVASIPLAHGEGSLDARVTSGAPVTPNAPTPTPASAPGAREVADLANVANTRDSRSGAPGRKPAATPDMRAMREATPPKVESTFALGPIVAAGDSDAMPEASESGRIERAWENTRDATSKAMDASARAVDTATKTAGKATKTATSKAAAGVKAGSTHTVRAFGRVGRTLASVF